MQKNERRKKLYCQAVRLSNRKKTYSLFSILLQQVQKSAYIGSNKKGCLSMKDLWKNVSYVSLAILANFSPKSLGTILPHFLMQSHMVMQTEFFLLEIFNFMWLWAKTQAFHKLTRLTHPWFPSSWGVSQRATMLSTKPDYSILNFNPDPGCPVSMDSKHLYSTGRSL